MATKKTTKTEKKTPLVIVYKNEHTGRYRASEDVYSSLGDALRDLDEYYSFDGGFFIASLTDWKFISLNPGVTDADCPIK